MNIKTGQKSPSCIEYECVVDFIDLVQNFLFSTRSLYNLSHNSLKTNSNHMVLYLFVYFSPQFDRFELIDLNTAFEEDALASSHPLSSPPEAVQTMQEILEEYDEITYFKVERGKRHK